MKYILNFKFTSDPDVRTKDLEVALSFYSDAKIKDIQHKVNSRKIKLKPATKTA